MKAILALVMLWVVCFFMPISSTLLVFRGLRKTLNFFSKTSLYEDTIGWIIDGAGDVPSFYKNKIKKSFLLVYVRKSINSIYYRIHGFIRNDLPRIYNAYRRIFFQEVIPLVLGAYKGLWLILKRKIVRVPVLVFSYFYYIQYATITTFRVTFYTTLFRYQTYLIPVYYNLHHKELADQMMYAYMLFTMYLLILTVLEFSFADEESKKIFGQCLKKNKNLTLLEKLRLQERHLPKARFLAMIEELLLYQLPWRISDFIFRETSLIPIYIVDFFKANPMLLRNVMSSIAAAFSEVYTNPTCIFKFDYYSYLNRLTKYFSDKILDYLVFTVNSFIRKCKIHLIAVVILSWQIETTGIIPGNFYPVRTYTSEYMKNRVRFIPFIGKYLYSIYWNTTFVFSCFTRFVSVFFEMEHEKVLEQYYKIRSALYIFQKLSDYKIYKYVYNKEIKDSDEFKDCQEFKFYDHNRIYKYVYDTNLGIFLRRSLNENEKRILDEVKKKYYFDNNVEDKKKKEKGEEHPFNDDIQP